MIDIKMPTGCELVDIEKLVHYEKNPKNHTDKDINLIIKSIKRNIIKCPIKGI